MKTMLPHPGEILRKYFETKKRQKPGYSLRLLARDAKLSPSFVSQVFSKKRTPSQESISSFVKALRVKSSDVQILRRGVIMYSASQRQSQKILSEYIERDESVRALGRFNKNGMQALLPLTKWYHLALLELLTCELESHDDRSLAKELGISLFELRDSIQTLLAAGLIERAHLGGLSIWRKRIRFIEFPEELSNEATRQYHRTMIGHAVKVMSEDSRIEEVRRRRIIGATVAVNPLKIDEVIRELNEFLFRLTRELGDGVCREVYQINLQMVPLTRRKAE